MELDEVVLEQLKFLAKVDFTKTSTTVSLFETSVGAPSFLLERHER